MFKSRYLFYFLLFVVQEQSVYAMQTVVDTLGDAKKAISEKGGGD
jgi:hypothetical protein